MTVHRELGVNVDHVATLRQQRGTRYPEPLQAALIAEQAGADSITVHLREDRRHIQERDVWMMSDALVSPLNLEMAATDAMVAIACQIQPAYCCLVPERREELTTEGGLDVVGARAALTEVCERLEEAAIRVSLFVDADRAQIDAAAAIGVPAIELHTGPYADARAPAERAAALARITQSAGHAHSAGLIVNAGHGLHYHNVAPLAALPELSEFNIGHAIVSRAVITGMAAAVREMKALLVSRP